MPGSFSFRIQVTVRTSNSQKSLPIWLLASSLLVVYARPDKERIRTFAEFGWSSR
jgi:hypothetical protein